MLYGSGWTEASLGYMAEGIEEANSSFGVRRYLVRVSSDRWDDWQWGGVNDELAFGVMYGEAKKDLGRPLVWDDSRL